MVSQLKCTVGSRALECGVREHNGFALAEKDLEIRGPGEFFARKITEIGRGKFFNIKRAKDLPIKALDVL
jgi:RecG-like helicase